MPEAFSGFGFVLLVIALILALKSFGINQEYQRGVVFRLGRLRATKGPLSHPTQNTNTISQLVRMMPSKFFSSARLRSPVSSSPCSRKDIRNATMLESSNRPNTIMNNAPTCWVGPRFFR